MYNHTYDALNALKAQGTTAGMVQIGNEINTGMLWPEGSTDNWSQLAGLLKAGVSATKAVSSSTQVALHLAHGGDNALYRWWFDNATAQGPSLVEAVPNSWSRRGMRRSRGRPPRRPR